MLNNWLIALDALIQTIGYQELVEIILNAKIGNQDGGENSCTKHYVRR